MTYHYVFDLYTLCDHQLFVLLVVQAVLEILYISGNRTVSQFISIYNKHIISLYVNVQKGVLYFFKYWYL
jgi:hypothetical protein